MYFSIVSITILMFHITTISSDNVKLDRSRRSSNVTCPERTCRMPSSLITERQSRWIVNVHNEMRRSIKAVAMRKIYYNETLASRAQAMADKCRIAHEESCLCDGTPLGQNLYVSKQMENYQTPSGGVADYVRNWFSEIKNYNLKTSTCQKNTLCGHFLQIISQDTHQVGCGIQRCRRLDDAKFSYWEVFVCDYFPQFSNAVIDVDGTPCSQCNKLSYSPFYGYKCDNKLCDACQPGTVRCTSMCKDRLSVTNCKFLTENGGCHEGSLASFAQYECPKSCGLCGI